jgi:hypothetical protein
VTVCQKNAHFSVFERNRTFAEDPCRLLVFLILLAPQVGLEPTTLRLTAVWLPFSVVLKTQVLR